MYVILSVEFWSATDQHIVAEMDDNDSMHNLPDDNAEHLECNTECVGENIEEFSGQNTFDETGRVLEGSDSFEHTDLSDTRLQDLKRLYVDCFAALWPADRSGERKLSLETLFDVLVCFYDTLSSCSLKRDSCVSQFLEESKSVCNAACEWMLLLFWPNLSVEAIPTIDF